MKKQNLMLSLLVFLCVFSAIAPAYGYTTLLMYETMEDDVLSYPYILSPGSTITYYLGSLTHEGVFVVDMEWNASVGSDCGFLITAPSPSYNVYYHFEDGSGTGSARAFGHNAPIGDYYLKLNNSASSNKIEIKFLIVLVDTTCTPGSGGGFSISGFELLLIIPCLIGLILLYFRKRQAPLI